MSIEWGASFPVLSAIILGIIGAMEPCQLSNNTAAFLLIGKKGATIENLPKRAFLFFVFGKIAAYWVLGFCILTFGHSISDTISPLFDWVNKLLGPLFILMGLFLLRVIHIPFKGRSFATRMLHPLSSRQDSGEAAFGVGVVMALGFCPTMFWLFFGLLVPLMFASSLGVILPVVFALGTAVPLFISIWFLIRLRNHPSANHHSKRWGSIIHRVAGVILILLGIREIVTYWI